MKRLENIEGKLYLHLEKKEVRAIPFGKPLLLDVRMPKKSDSDMNDEITKAIETRRQRPYNFPTEADAFVIGNHTQIGEHSFVVAIQPYKIQA